ncbi:mRNA interferase RelE/StbE [Alphaproteobacteria bacterium]
MAWKIEFTSSAEKEFGKLSRDIQKRIRNFLREKVIINPRAYGIAMQGSNVIKLWRYRIGDYRFICQIKDEELTILLVKIGNRDSVYKTPD